MDSCGCCGARKPPCLGYELLGHQQTFSLEFFSCLDVPHGYEPPLRTLFHTATDTLSPTPKSASVCLAQLRTRLATAGHFASLVLSTCTLKASTNLGGGVPDTFS